MLAGVDVGLVRAWRRRRSSLPRDVVVAAAGLLDVLDAVDVAAPPSVPQVLGELVAALREHVLDQIAGVRRRDASVP